MSTNYKIIEEFEKKSLENNSLFQVEIDITNKCNANCIFCYQGNEHNHKENELTFEEIIEIFDQLREMGTYYLQISGGEPFSRKDTLDIIKAAKERGFRTSIITNGTYLNNDIIDELSILDLDRINVSFHAVDLDAYNKIFGFKNKNIYNRVLDNIKYMLFKGINVGISATINKCNVDDIEKLYSFFVELGVKSSNFSFQNLIMGEKDINGLMPNETSLIKCLNFTDNIFGFDSFSSFTCAAGLNGCTIDSVGNVKPCSFYNVSAGNIRELPIEEIWNNSDLFKIIRSINDSFFEKCCNCEHKTKCHVCVASNLNETGNPFVPSERYCSLNKSRFNKN